MRLDDPPQLVRYQDDHEIQVDAELENVDCIWRWRSLALLRGERPTK